MREFLQLHLQDWREDIPGRWAEIFHQSLANFDAVDPDLPAPQDVFPRLRRDNPDGARSLLRAFDALAPADVRVIIIGQDPYPDPIRATGQAFEDGAIGQVAETTSPSLRRLVQAATADLLQREDLWQNDAGWGEIRQEFALPRMSQLFDGLASQGVIFLNAAWTFTGEGPQQLRINLRLWRPVMRQIILHLFQNDPNRVILALGAKSRGLFNSRCPRPAHFVHHCHPQERTLGWFHHQNPLTSVNNHLVGMQLAPVCWLPSLASPWQLPQ